MTLQEILKAKGLTDDAIAEIAADMKTNKIFTAGEENLDIRYNKLKGDYDALTGKHTQSEARIAELLTLSQGADAIKTELATAKAQAEQLQKELDTARIESAVKVGLLKAKAADIEYMTFKLKEKGELKLDENGEISGWEDKISGLKTQFPNQFETNGAKKVEPNKLPIPDGGNNGLTRKELLSKTYKERAELFNENPEAYAEAMKK